MIFCPNHNFFFLDFLFFSFYSFSHICLLSLSWHWHRCMYLYAVQQNAIYHKRIDICASFFPECGVLGSSFFNNVHVVSYSDICIQLSRPKHPKLEKAFSKKCLTGLKFICSMQFSVFSDWKHHQYEVKLSGVFWTFEKCLVLWIVC